MLQDIQLKENRHKRFMEREAKMRAVVREAKQNNEPDNNPQSKVCNNDEFKFGTSTSVAEQKLAAAKPMWALTEQQAHEATDHIGGVDVDGLLEFANSLDFDKYMEDSEVSCLIENVRARINELEAKADVSRSESHAINRVARALEVKGGSQAAPTHPDGMSTDAKGDIMSVARSVLDSDVGKEFASVHSQKSLAAVAERSSRTAMETLDVIAEEATPVPFVRKHTDDAGSRLAGKNCVSNLPYMHRNPAV